jgi:hypothetical protein
VESAESITVGVEAILCVKLSVEWLSLKDYLSDDGRWFIIGHSSTWDFDFFQPLVVEWSGHIDKSKQSALAFMFSQALVEALGLVC